MGSRPPGTTDQITIEQCRLMVAQDACSPSDAVLCVKLGRERPSGKSGVQLFLGQPGGELSVAVEAEGGADVSDDVMNGPKPVVGTAQLTSHQRMAAVAIRCR